MMAAIAAAENGNKVTLIEQNEKLGKKLFLTGKGRCNITNACPVEELFDNIVTNPVPFTVSIMGQSLISLITRDLRPRLREGNVFFRKVIILPM